jgi:hypothetical protein
VTQNKPSIFFTNLAANSSCCYIIVKKKLELSTVESITFKITCKHQKLKFISKKQQYIVVKGGLTLNKIGAGFFFGGGGVGTK